MRLRSAFDPRRFSVRGLSTAAIAGIGALMLVVVVALVVTSSILQQTSTRIVRSTRSVALAEEIELHLLAHERFGNLALATGEPTATAAEKRAHDEALRLVNTATRYAKTSDEIALLKRATERTNAYLQARDALEARGLGVRDVVRGSQHQLALAVSSLEALRGLHRRAVERARVRAQRAAATFKIAAVSAGLLVLLALLVISIGVRRYFLHPIARLRRAIDEFRDSRREPPAAAPAPRELAAITDAFNDMSSTLIRQRQGQLTFLAGVAHDLRNPLSAIKTAVQILDKKTSDESRTTAILNRQIDHLDRMVGDLMEASRIEAGRLELHLTDVDLREPARDIAELYRPMDPRHPVAVELPEVPVPVRVDRLRIEQVIGNLMKNAITYSPEGGSVTIAVAIRVPDAEVAVSDCGIGISPDQLEDIFLPFRRHASGPGTGLGLSVVRGIVTAHGGSITVDSEPGTGSTFRVRIPLAPPPEPAADAANRDAAH